MSIQTVQGIAVRCTVCAKSGPLIRFDPLRYRHTPGFPNHPNEDYIRTINSEAEKSAIIEGFIALANPPPPPPLPVNHNHGDDGDDMGIADQPNQNYRTLRHICPACIVSLSDSIIKRGGKKKKK